VLQNYVQLAQGARAKVLPPLLTGALTLSSSADFNVTISVLQILIILSPSR